MHENPYKPFRRVRGAVDSAKRVTDERFGAWELGYNARCPEGWIVVRLDEHEAGMRECEALRIERDEAQAEVAAFRQFTADPNRRNAMSHPFYDQTRLIVANLEGEDSPLIVGALGQTTWEIMPVEEWDAWKREMAERWLGPDWTAYDLIEVVVTIPQADLLALFAAHEITPTSVFRDDEEGA